MLCHTGLTRLVIFDIWALWRSELSKIKNGGLDQYGAEPFEQQQFGTAGVERVNTYLPKIKMTRDLDHAHLGQFVITGLLTAGGKTPVLRGR